MNKIFKSNQSIGSIVVQFPGASEIFKEYNIDFRCGGDRLLDTALREQSLNENEILDKLNKAYKKSAMLDKKQTDWLKTSSADIISHVVNTHHAYLYKELPIIGELVEKILRAHGAHHGQMLSNVHKLFNTLRMDLEQHLIKEETTLFPMIREYERNNSPELRIQISDIIKETEGEHHNAGDILKELSKVTSKYSVPDDGCPTFHLAYSKLKELESDLFQHIHLENNIIFTRYE